MSASTGARGHFADTFLLAPVSQPARAKPKRRKRAR
jgi:hypothetical protein